VDFSDEQLINSYLSTNDLRHFKTLIMRYQDRLYGSCVRMLNNVEEAEEVVQETYIRVHQSIAKFDKRSTFASWVFRIAHNLCIDRIRTAQRRKSIQLLPLDLQSSYSGEEATDNLTVSQIADSGPSPDESLAMSEQFELIEKSLKLLPENQRSVIILHDIEGFSYEEVANIIGANLGTVRSRIHYGRLKLRELLAPYYTNQPVPNSR
jgi:RNA polymerase sigma-70 factor (ECF subfamily)